MLVLVPPVNLVHKFLSMKLRGVIKLEKVRKARDPEETLVEILNLWMIEPFTSSKNLFNHIYDTRTS